MAAQWLLAAVFLQNMGIIVKNLHRHEFRCVFELVLSTHPDRVRDRVGRRLCLAIRVSRLIAGLSTKTISRCKDHTVVLTLVVLDDVVASIKRLTELERLHGMD